MSDPTTFELLLAQMGGRITVKLDEACALYGISSKTYRNRKSLGKEPFPAYGHPSRVDLRDVAAHIDALRTGAKNAPRVSPKPPRKLGRPTKSEQARRAAAQGGAQ